MDLSKLNWTGYISECAVPINIKDSLSWDMVDKIMSDDNAMFEIEEMYFISGDYPIEEVLDILQSFGYDDVYITFDEAVESITNFDTCYKDNVEKFWTDTQKYLDRIENGTLYDRNKDVLIVPKYYYE